MGLSVCLTVCLSGCLSCCLSLCPEPRLFLSMRSSKSRLLPLAASMEALLSEEEPAEELEEDGAAGCGKEEKEEDGIMVFPFWSFLV